MRGDERLHQIIALAVVDDIDLHAARTDIILGSLKRAVLADDDFRNLLQQRRAAAHVAG